MAQLKDNLGTLGLLLLLISLTVVAYAVTKVIITNFGSISKTGARGLVTEDNNYVYVENIFYKACIRKGAMNTWQPYFGTTEKFYIKPHDSVNVMSAGSSVHGDCHKFYRKWPNEVQFGQWQSSGAGPYVYTPVTILANTTDYAVLYYEFSIGSDKNLRVREWKTFYYNRPYVLVQWEDQWVNEEKRFEQHQVDIGWNPSWTDRRIYMSHLNGSLVTENRPSSGKLDEPRYVAWKMAELNKTYTWMAFHNNADNDGMGIILLDFSPRGNVGEFLLEDFWSTSANDFNRIQIGVEQEYHDSGYGFPASDRYFGRNHVSYLLYAYDDSFPDSSSWTSAQKLAKDIWAADYKSQYNELPASGGTVSTQAGNIIWNTRAGYDSSSDRVRTFVPSHYGYPMPEGAGGELNLGLYVRMTDATQDNVDLWTGTLSIENGYQAPDYGEANVTYSRNGSLLYKLKTTITYHTYNNSSRVYITCQWTATDAVTLDKLWLRFSMNVPGSWFSHTNHNSTTGKVENSKSYLWGRFGAAYFVTAGKYYNAWYFGVSALDNGGSPKSYPAGTTWKASLFLQSFGQANPFDFTKDFAEKEIWAFYWNNHYVRLFNTTSSWTTPFEVLDIGSGEFHLLYHDYNAVVDQLYLRSEGSSITPTSFAIRSGGKGAPRSVTFNGAPVSFDYDPVTDLVIYQGQHDANHNGQSVITWSS